MEIGDERGVSAEVLRRSAKLFRELREVLAEANELRAVSVLELSVADEGELKGLVGSLSSERAHFAELGRLYMVAAGLLDQQRTLWQSRYPDQF